MQAALAVTVGRGKKVWKCRQIDKKTYKNKDLALNAKREGRNTVSSIATCVPLLPLF